MENEKVKKFCSIIYGKIGDKSILGVTDDELYNIYSSIKEEKKKEEEIVQKEESNDEDKKEESNDEDKKEENEELKPEKILKLNKKSLSALCKKYKVKVSGKKAEQIQRLLAVANGDGKVNTITSSVKNKKKSKKSSVSLSEKPLFKKIEETIPVIQIRKNKHGNFEHQETGFVFDNLDKHVYGKQNEDEVDPLTKEDIELCHKFHFLYRVPENLGTTKITQEDTELLDEKILEEFKDL